jgi:hypothetical protein
MSEAPSAPAMFDPSKHWKKASSTVPQTPTAPIVPPPAVVAPPPAPPTVAPPAVAPQVTPQAPPVQSAVPQVPIPPAPIAAPPPTLPQMPDAVDDDEDESFGQAHTLKFGERKSRFPINRFKGVEGQVSRVSILTVDEWYFVKTHFLPKFGNLYCFESTCCESGDAAVRYLAPIVEYATDREGNLIQAPFTIKYLSLADDAYNNLIMMSKSFPLNQIDLIITCQDTKYQKLTYQPACAPGQAVWLQNEGFKNAVWTKYQSLKKHILRSFAKRLGKTQAECEATYARVINQNQVSSPSEASPGAVQFDMAEYLKNMNH